MKIHDLIQGSPEWLAYRAQHFNASDAPAMMGCSPYKTRAELLRELHTGLVADVDVATQKRFDNGHRAEALARPLAEEKIGEELYPVTGSLGRLSASFDGLTLAEDECFEHKALNEALRACFAAIDTLKGGGDEAPGRLLPIYHRVQMEQQLHISGAGRCLFMASKWTAAGELVEERSTWYLPDMELRQQILDGWTQFEKDLASYVLTSAPEAAPVGKAPDTLPALRIEVTGMVTASNLAEFKQTALDAIRSVNRTLTTDQNFADAEKAVKWCGDVEARLAAAKQHALSQTASIDELFKAIDDIAAESKRVRLDLDKLVTRRKSEVRDEAVSRARAELDKHIATLQAEIAPMRLLPITADFAGAIKGKRSITSMQDALDGVLVVAKVAAENEARAIRANVASFQATAAGYETLFADLGQLVHKAADDFALIVQARISNHKAAEALRQQQAAEREAKRVADEASEAERRRKLALDQESVKTAGNILGSLPKLVEVGAMPKDMAERIGGVVSGLAADAAAGAAKAKAQEPATLKLGDINSRLAPLKIDAAGMAEMGISPARTEGSAKLYRESDFERLLRGIAKHIESLQAVPA